MTLRLTVAPSVTVRAVGGVSICGGVGAGFTVSRALALTAVPKAFVIATEYAAASVARTLVKVSVAWVAPANHSPSFRH